MGIRRLRWLIRLVIGIEQASGSQFGFALLMFSKLFQDQAQVMMSLRCIGSHPNGGAKMGFSVLKSSVPSKGEACVEFRLREIRLKLQRLCQGLDRSFEVMFTGQS